MSLMITSLYVLVVLTNEIRKPMVMVANSVQGSFEYTSMADISPQLRQSLSPTL